MGSFFGHLGVAFLAIGHQKWLSYITRRTTIGHKWVRNTLLDDLSKCIWSFSQAFGHFDHFQMSCPDRSEIFSTCSQPSWTTTDRVWNSNEFPRWNHKIAFRMAVLCNPTSNSDPERAKEWTHGASQNFHGVGSIAVVLTGIKNAQNGNKRLHPLTPYFNKP